MLDISDLPLRDNTQVFYANYVIQTWQKPRGCKFVCIFSLGGGGGGGGGANTPIGTNRQGAGGGGSGGFYHNIIPAIFLPDILYLLVSTGGRGGNPNLNGSGAAQSNYVRVGNLITALPQGMSFITPNRGNPGQAGGVGGTSVGSAFGTYGRSSISNSSLLIGQTGGAGVSASSGTSLNILFPVTAGAAGGGVSSGGASFAGGDINPNGFVPLIQGGQNAGDNGQNGFGVYNTIDILTSSNPFFFTGGAGGAGNATGTGGNGGKGGFGCGGGGGGAGVTGGRGGDGGDGLIIISWW
jgi:hypothetical protein